MPHPHLIPITKFKTLSLDMITAPHQQLFPSWIWQSKSRLMGRHANDSAVPNSTIALLQERFRQLQRVKEMREEKELMRLVAETENRATPPPYCSTSGEAAFCHPDAMALLNYRAAASPTPDQCGAQIKHLGFLQPADMSGGLSRVHRAGEELRFLSCTSHVEDDSSEVDTSLHL